MRKKWKRREKRHMNKLLFPIIMIVICLVAILGLFIYLQISKQTSKKKGKQDSKQQKTAQDFVNVKDMKDIFLYTMENDAISYIKVQPIEKDLLSATEKKLLTRRLTEEFSDLDREFKFLAVSRAVDITPLVIDYSERMKMSSDTIQKDILRNEMNFISGCSLSGEVVQREFYYILWEKEGEEDDLRKAANEFKEKLQACGLKSEIIKKPDMIRLCNLVNNPSFATIEDTGVEPIIPYIY